jgi:hypothetical protein
MPQGDFSRADAPGHQPAEYRVSFPKILTRVVCPVSGCSGNASSWTNLCRHFTYWHPHDVIVILEEGRLPQCKLCGMHVPMPALAGGHRNSAFCREGVACNRQRLAAEEAALAHGVSFMVEGAPLEQVSAFKYLGRPLSSTDDDWPAIYSNLSKVHQCWAMVSWVLTREGADPRLLCFTR